MRQAGKEKIVTKKNDDFIMLPTVDVCFRGLMYNPKVRKGFIAALLGADPAAVRETVLLPTALRQEYPDEKLGILDVRALMEDGAQINMEMQILELKKLPEELQSDDEVIRWMRFLAGKNRKELEDMAGTSEYIEEAYRELERMSADERARLEYEARQKAIRDHDAIMSSAWETGMEKGLQEGMKQGMQQGIRQERQDIVFRMLEKGMDPEVIADLTGTDVEEIRELEKGFGARG